MPLDNNDEKDTMNDNTSCVDKHSCAKRVGGKISVGSNLRDQFEMSSLDVNVFQAPNISPEKLKTLLATHDDANRANNPRVVAHVHLELTQDLLDTLAENKIYFKEETEEHYDSYYDTEDWQLAKKNMWLRIRSGEDWIFRKVSEGANNTKHIRDEREFTNVMRRLADEVKMIDKPDLRLEALAYCPVQIANFRTCRIRSRDERIYLDAAELQPEEYHVVCCVAIYEDDTDDFNAILNASTADDET